MNTTESCSERNMALAPEKYRDVYGGKTIKATHPVIVLCGYGSWAILYAWTGEEVDKVWISD